MGKQPQFVQVLTLFHLIFFSGAYSISSNLWYPPDYRISCGGLGWIIEPEGNILKTTNPDSPLATVEKISNKI
jgi:hypothetical protein